MPDDYYVSQYSGEEIDALLGGAGAGTVRYDAAQSLTDGQKAQARGNINAAPSGFGYGENKAFTTWDDNDGSQFEAFVDQMIDGTSKVVRLTGLADYPANVVSGNSGFADIRFYTDGTVLVLFHGPLSIVEGSIDGVYHASKKRLNNGTWLPWEYDNPPLALGVEYRTTERYLGKPVYVKVVDCGNLPASGLKNIAHGIANCKPIHVYGEMSNGNTLPYATGTNFYISADGDYIQIYVTGDLSGQTAKATIKYTKTTD